MSSIERVFIEHLCTWVRSYSGDAWEMLSRSQETSSLLGRLVSSLVFPYHLAIHAWNAVLQESKFSRIECCEILTMPAA